jgi:hypothetical protein
MSNPFTAAAGWLLANPLVSHAAVALAGTAALSGVGHAAGVGHTPVIAGLVVATFYYGREAGQREHDLKHMTPPKSGLMAFLGADFGFLWSLDNFVQWLAAAGSAAATAAALTYAGL